MAMQPDIQYVSYYMDGSAAKKMERRILEGAAAPKPKYRKAKRKVVKIDPVAMAGIAVSVVMLVAMLIGINQYQDCMDRTQQMSQYITQLEQENAVLQDTYDNGYDLDEIRQIAEAIGMVPAESVEEISIEVQVPEQEVKQLSFWEEAITFLAGLFA